MPDIVALGEPMVEFNEQPDGRYLQGFGGDTSNAIIAAARLGASTRYLTLLGKDRFGDDLMALWQRDGVETSFIKRHASAPTAVYFVNHTAAGHTFSYLRAGSAASHMAWTDFAATAFSGAKLLHISAVSQAISYSARDMVGQAVELAQQAGAYVSYDTNLRLQLWSLEDARSAIHATAHRAHILKTSIEDATSLIGLTAPEAVADHYLELGANIVVVTLGADGALVATPEERERLAPHKVAAVDATGAGDAFAGAMLASLARGLDPFAAARFANAAAALATTGYGAVAPLPTHEEVERLLQV
jgi:2-dehydro-3-deoxygluconokinase